MNEQELLDQITQIGTCEDAAARRQMLTDLGASVKGVFGTLSTVTAERQALEENNKKLQEYNMQLFLRVGSPQQQKPQEDKPAEKLTYENLFDENGGIK